MQPPGKRLDPEPDEAEAELRKAQAELVKLRSKLPKLVLRFSNGMKVLPASPRPYQKQSDVALDMFVGRELAKFQAGKHVSDSYRRMLREFADENQKFLCVTDITLAVQLELANDGDGPTDDIHVRVSFPKGLDVTDEAPKQPVQPRPGDENRALMRAILPHEKFVFPTVDLDPSWTLDTDVAQFRIERVLQKRKFDFPTLYLRPTGGGAPSSCGLKAHVVVGAPADDREFDLGIKIEGEA